MPYKSEKQRKYFNANREKLEADGVDVDEWNKASKGKKLPKTAPDSKKKKQASQRPPVNRMTCAPSVSDTAHTLTTGIFGALKRANAKYRAPEPPVYVNLDIGRTVDMADLAPAAVKVGSLQEFGDSSVLKLAKFMPTEALERLSRRAAAHEKRSRNMGISGVPKGPGWGHMPMAAASMARLKTLVRPPDDHLKHRGISRKNFERGFGEIMRGAGPHKLNISKTAPNARSQAIMGALAGGMLGTGAGYVGGDMANMFGGKSTTWGPSVAGGLAGAGLGGLVHYLKAMAKRKRLAGAGHILKDYGVLTADHARDVGPLLVDKIKYGAARSIYAQKSAYASPATEVRKERDATSTKPPAARSTLPAATTGSTAQPSTNPVQPHGMGGWGSNAAWGHGTPTRATPTNKWDDGSAPTPSTWQQIKRYGRSFVEPGSFAHNYEQYLPAVLNAKVQGQTLIGQKSPSALLGRDDGSDPGRTSSAPGSRAGEVYQGRNSIPQSDAAQAYKRLNQRTYAKGGVAQGLGDFYNQPEVRDAMRNAGAVVPAGLEAGADGFGTLGGLGMQAVGAPYADTVHNESQALTHNALNDLTRVTGLQGIDATRTKADAVDKQFEEVQNRPGVTPEMRTGSKAVRTAAEAAGSIGTLAHAPGAVASLTANTPKLAPAAALLLSGMKGRKYLNKADGMVGDAYSMSQMSADPTSFNEGVASTGEDVAKTAWKRMMKRIVSYAERLAKSKAAK